LNFVAEEHMERSGGKGGTVSVELTYLVSRQALDFGTQYLGLDKILYGVVVGLSRRTKITIKTRREPERAI
jgi:hypothetical protein